MGGKMLLERKYFKDVDLADPFFDSLKASYSEFSDWFARKAQDSAYVFTNEHGAIDGFLYVKVEDGVVPDVNPVLPAARRLKIGTLKINAHGTKLGERFIKKIFDHATYEGVHEIYVTVFDEHAPLIALLERYGFVRRASKTSANGIESVLVKRLHDHHDNIVARYPIVNLSGQRAYLLSLRPEWHTRLLPDSILKTEAADIVQDISHTNSIHKVYLTAMRGVDALQLGDVLLIYRTSDGQGAAHHRSVATSICVVEEFRSIHSFGSREAFLGYCRPYSVFTEDELGRFWTSKRYPHVVRFTYNIALKKRITRGAMIEDAGLDASAYWGFLPLSHAQFLTIIQRGGVHESLVVH
jgi:L-amino acid N-acyltransferase YncA